jgi:hypothetical protein
MSYASRRKSVPTQAGGLIANVVSSYGVPEEAQLMSLTAWWVGNLPVRIAQNARPVRMARGGTLIVNTTTSTWAAELSFETERWLGKLKLAFPKLGIKALRIQAGPLPDVPLPRPIDADDPIPALRPLPQVPESLARELTHLRDDDLREAVEVAIKANLGRRIQSGR